MDILLNEKVLIAAISLVSAGVGSILTTFLAPWVKWKIDEKRVEAELKRQDISEKKEKIVTWRKMILRINEQSETTGFGVNDLLHTDEDFLSLEPHLKEEVKVKLYGEQHTFVVGEVLNHTLPDVKEEINRLEKEWFS